MWRSVSIARSSLSRRAGSKLSSLRNQSQVLPKTLSPKPYQSHFASATAFPANPLSQNPRFFSLSSLDHSEPEPEDESGSDANSHLASPDVQKIDGDNVFGEAHNETSSDSESSGLGLDGIKENSDELMDVFGLIDQPIGESVEKEGAIDAEKLEEVLSLLQSSVDASLESSLSGLKLSLNEEFVLRVLETPLVPGGPLIRFFRWAVEKEKVPITTPVVDALVRGVCQNVKRNDSYALWDLIKEIGVKENSLLNAEILNDLISSFSKLGKGKAAFEVFNKFEEFGCVPNSDTYYNTIEALCRRSIYTWASLVANKMLDSGILPDSDKIGQIMFLFCKGKKPKEAHLVYTSVKKSSREPPPNAVKFLISALAREDETVGLALEMLEDISPVARKRATTQYYHVIQGLCRIKSVDRAKELLQKMVEAGPPPGNPVFNSVIGGLSKAGDLDDAVATMRVMQRRGLKPDVFTYSVIMSGYTKGGLMAEACKLLKEAKREHTKLCPATFHTLIRGYCKLGDHNKALKLLSEMESYGVEPNVDEYNKLIQSLCLEALDWRRAEKLLEEMKVKGLSLPDITKGLMYAVKEIEQEVLTNAAASVEATVEA